VFRRGDDGDVIVVAALRADAAVTGIAAVSDGETADITILYGPARERLPTVKTAS